MASEEDDKGITHPSPYPPLSTTDTHPLKNIIIGKKNPSNLIDILDR